MSINIKISGGKELAAALERMSGQIRQKVGDEIEDIATEAKTEIVLRMQQGPHTGRIYRRGGVAHQASAPGQPPAPDTGALLGSIYAEREGELTSIVGSRMEYAHFLEYGTSKMAPRPVWRPVAEEIGQTIGDDLRRVISEALK